MSRIDEIADMVYGRHSDEEYLMKNEIAKMQMLLYTSELRRKIVGKMQAIIDGDSPQRDVAITECIRIVEETDLT